MLRKMLAYSSINHLGWLLLAMTGLSQVWMTYFFIYCILVSLVVVILMNLSIFHLNQLMSSFMPWEYKVIILLSMFSLGGMPPLLGFLPKWVLIKQCITPSSMIYMSVMIFTSVVTLFFYSRLGVSALLISQKMNPKNFLWNKEILSAVGFLSVFGFGLVGWFSMVSMT
uniref:NADH-ubiquinone oxidoreductase chain 2 n=1 Tax=Oniscus asellus TaxID=96861 RepID=A0A1P8DKE9_ONIAS|nr:NADH dehydrogenase subunit 2 [Oniscus asellus]